MGASKKRWTDIFHRSHPRADPPTRHVRHVPITRASTRGPPTTARRLHAALLNGLFGIGCSLVAEDHVRVTARAGHTAAFLHASFIFHDQSGDLCCRQQTVLRIWRLLIRALRLVSTYHELTIQYVRISSQSRRTLIETHFTTPSARWFSQIFLPVR